MPEQNATESLIKQARQCMRRRDFSKALDLYKAAVDEDGRDIAAHEGVATAAFMLQDYDLAIKHFQRVGQLDPRRAQPLVNLGAIHNRQGDYRTAVQHLRKALSKDRRCAEAYYNLAIAHRGLNQLSMAVSAYREAIRLNPEMAEAYQNLANVYLEMGNTQQAVLNYKRALDIRPDFERARRGLEEAQRVAFEAKQSRSPFGRLVDTEQAALAQSQEATRVLTPQERFDDRTKVHEYAKKTERAAVVLLNQVRDDLERRLLQLTHAFSQSDDRYHFNPEYEAFRQAHADFREAVHLVKTQTDALRAHEEFIRS